MKTISVSSFQGALPSGVRRPPHKSTTFSPRQYAATAAPISPRRPSKLRSNSARTSSKPGATNPETPAFELSLAVLAARCSSFAGVSFRMTDQILPNPTAVNVTRLLHGEIGDGPSVTRLLHGDIGDGPNLSRETRRSAAAQLTLRPSIGPRRRCGKPTAVTSVWAGNASTRVRECGGTGWL
jgi:hypothetical protein